MKRTFLNEFFSTSQIFHHRILVVQYHTQPDSPNNDDQRIGAGLLRRIFKTKSDLKLQTGKAIRIKKECYFYLTKRYHLILNILFVTGNSLIGKNTTILTLSIPKWPPTFSIGKELGLNGLKQAKELFFVISHAFFLKCLQCRFPQYSINYTIKYVQY